MLLKYFHQKHFALNNMTNNEKKKAEKNCHIGGGKANLKPEVEGVLVGKILRLC